MVGIASLATPPNGPGAQLLARGNVPQATTEFLCQKLPNSCSQHAEAGQLIALLGGRLLWLQKVGWIVSSGSVLDVRIVVYDCEPASQAAETQEAKDNQCPRKD
jgi:hypothetical protein